MTTYGLRCEEPGCPPGNYEKGYVLYACVCRMAICETHWLSIHRRHTRRNTGGVDRAIRSPIQ